VGAEDHLIWIPGHTARINIAFSSAAAALVGADDRCIEELVLGDGRLNDASEVTRAAAGPGSHDELDRFRRLPGVSRRNTEHRYCGSNTDQLANVEHLPFPLQVDHCCSCWISRRLDLGSRSSRSFCIRTVSVPRH